ncbi:MAG: phosphoenolpyruvate carboxykinase (GTP) [Verrucomicrobia bacterium]|jgi:phosphoenolpyruvate carboxykinase (GTP)|nr:phosphoenolpyruvate carboxykinase (GTP) [Verrucomicrobiota bacterium]OQC24537.1 MAG: Phosphoenolpyruvate carboxykinase (GTP) [Verrucomicrobia bacterium ADurb.Bin063]HRY57360.1 phosphoenolpyruvate carboxykinase (GTP) [Candidatus Paceibacterota bacterium]MBP8015324.1 phosphoenolpyruvate carboxykinase (GTP) [Verrucomicrobiota bacterium]MDI9371677.1 phosphoenolpyruvate carboxykinase (GTP) [Verrucomicrobiota bacterium]
MTKSTSGKGGTANKAVLSWVDQIAKLCKPDRVYWCNGSKAERKALIAEAVASGVLLKLNPKKRPGCYYHRSNPNDVARVEQSTFMCSESQEEAGPTNNWMAPKEMYERLYGYAAGSMRGRTLYVVPYLMGPPGSPMAKVGFELTDSIYVALSMGAMTRMGDVALEELGNREDFNRGLHCMLDIHPERRYISHFPKDNAVISVGSNYGGNVLLGKKCLALRIGSCLGRQEGWMAEHMLILGVESPTGEKTYVAAAFPSACGKTNFAMMMPPARLKGWRVWTIGDDIAWMKPGPDGRLYAINPEAGYFGVVPGTNSQSNPAAVEMISHDTIFTNVALTPDLDVWWEGKDGSPPRECLDWKGNKWTPDSREKAAHPNSRFTAPMANNPLLAPEANDPQGVPISAIIFGGRRSDTMPLVFQAFNWGHGVYVGATMGSEMTAAAVGGAGQVRRDPMAMLPFCGYHMGDYLRHWINMHKAIKHPPRIFHVNWFRKDQQGAFLWPGFGENMRVLKWIVDRCHARADAEESALGWVPKPDSLDLAGLSNFTPARFEQVQAIHAEEWRREIMMHEELFIKLHTRLPKELIFQRELLLARL